MRSNSSEATWTVADKLQSDTRSTHMFTSLHIDKAYIQTEGVTYILEILAFRLDGLLLVFARFFSQEVRRTGCFE